MDLSRRDIFQTLCGGAGMLLSRADAQVTPELVKCSPELEPLVALIERTPRERCAEMLAEQFRQGVSYRQAMAAVFLAGIRNVNPRPPGFALHCVFVIHSAHLLGLEAPADLRLLPLFYALDNFKVAQVRDAGQKTGDYNMTPLTGSLPSAERAPAEFTSAMEAWDTERAERAVASLARHRSANEVFAMLWRYGARDYRNIGHKAIYVANAYRTLEAVGWQHAEPVLRSLALSLLAFGKQEEVNGYAFSDQCYARNVELLQKTLPQISEARLANAADPAATRTVLASLREANADEACGGIAAGLAKNGTSAATVWDAVHLAAAELSMRTRGPAGIVGIHAVTSVNGLHHAYLAAHDRQMRLLLMLQAAGWMVQFRKWAEAREENLRPFPITDLQPAADTKNSQLAEIFSSPRSATDEPASQVLRLARDLPSRQSFWSGALRLTLGKADEVHYYKYLAALIEDVPLVGPEWQPHLVAASLYYMKRSGDPEPEAVKRAREALRALPA
jgi:hypothetical protein